ncbi:CAP domain-containing protein [Streptomyces kanasensis]|uniref:CAP domain-containing protein n=1 Tax=Streptomyces kanasensis TaxID=936756 RepID=UPI0037FAAC75
MTAGPATTGPATIRPATAGARSPRRARPRPAPYRTPRRRCSRRPAPPSPRRPGHPLPPGTPPTGGGPPPRRLPPAETAAPRAAAEVTPRPGRAPRAGTAWGTAARQVRRVVALTNAERAKAGCPALRADRRLRKAAQRHADDMAARDYYQHDTPEGRDAGDRVRAAGYRWSTWGENIHRGPRDPVTAVRDWMRSPTHRDNILNCAFRDIGVGVNLGSDGPWWVQDFAVAK